jgi:hypothetical protein
MLHQWRVGRKRLLTHGIIESSALEIMTSTERRNFSIPKMGHGIHYVSDVCSSLTKL